MIINVAILMSYKKNFFVAGFDRDWFLLESSNENQIRLVLIIEMNWLSELRNATACSEEMVQLECAEDEVIAVHNAYFDGNDVSGCGMMLPINITSFIDNKVVVNAEIRRFSVQSTVNKRWINIVHFHHPIAKPINFFPF